MTLEEKQEAILLLRKTQALIKNLNEQSRTDDSLYSIRGSAYFLDELVEEVGVIINWLGEAI